MLDKRMPTYRLTLVPCQFAILTLLLVGLLSTHLPTVNATLDASDARNDTGQVSRTRRQLYGGDDYYGSYYGWQAGRIVGWILGFIVLLLIICVPCVCCVGIWFAGWFGVRQAMARRRRASPAGANNPIFSSSGGVIRRTVADPPSPAEHRVVYAHASDRYFERRPRSPQAGTSNPNGDYRRS